MSSLLKRKHVLAATKRSYGSLVVADGASNYWKLDETSGLVAVDSIGGKNGTISGGVTLNQVGAVSKAMAFDGTSGLAESVATIQIPLIFTAEAWINSNNITAFRTVLGFGGYEFMLAMSGGGFISYCGNGLPVTVGSTILTVGQWYHLVIVHNNNVVNLYINGVLANGPVAQTHAIVSQTIAIGANPQSGGNYFSGLIDSVAWYPLALTPAQIAAHYASR